MPSCERAAEEHEEAPDAKRKRLASQVRAPSPGDADAAWLDWARLWAKWDPNASTRELLVQHVDAGRVADVRQLLGGRLEFGTAGLRGPMGVGSARMNDLVVLQSTQGVCDYLLRVFGDAAKDRGVCIGFDHRRRNGCNSRAFARQAAAVFLSKGVRVYLYENIVATPLVPWCLDLKGCCAGVMVTASHNPADDNGYKLYWANGAQIIPPHDERIAELIEANLEPWAAYDCANIEADPNCVVIGEEVIDAYFARLPSLSCFGEENAKLAPEFPVTYTAMHGVGHRFVQRAFDAFGHGRASLVGVSKQLTPDPDFPTVAFPNPEEGKGALSLAFEAAEAAGSALVIANDPDADRLAVAEKVPAESGAHWHVFTGNEIGALLGHWAWRCWRLRNPEAKPDKVCMVASAVSSKFLSALAEAEGFQFVETLTGFKWMGSKSEELRRKGFDVIFSFEEAIGFCFGDLVKDKDGVSASAVFVEMAKQLRQEGTSCLGHLRGLFAKYGNFVSLNSYVKCNDPQLTRRIFEAQRGGEGQRHYRDAVGEFKISGVRDLTIGFDSRTKDGEPELPLNRGGEMITYYFDAVNAQVTLRTSGTEPKIKFYSELRAPMGCSEAHAAEEELASLVRATVSELLDPAGNGLEVRPEDREFLLGAISDAKP